MFSFKIFLENRVAVFHGSKTVIVKWDASKHQSGYYPGFYTTANKDATTSHGDKVHEFAINPTKFYALQSDGENLKKLAAQSGFRVSQGSGFGEVQYLMSLGYEGLRRGQEYIVFEPEKTLPLPQEKNVHTHL